MQDRPDITNGDDDENFYFRYYTGIQEFNEAGRIAYDEMVNKSGFSGLKDWRKMANWSSLPSEYQEFTGATTVKELNEGQFNEFIEPGVLNNAINAFDEILANIDMGGAFQKSKLIITDNKMGIFDFGLASAGLYLVQEFFSEKLKEQHPFEFPTELPGIVPNLFVDRNAMGDFWYTSKEGEKYQMTQQPKGTEAMALNVPDAKKEYRTTTKKSYLMFEKKGGASKYVDLYVGCGGLGNMEASGMLARALPVMMAARYFESMKIKTRINASRMYYEGGVGILNYCWTVKDFGDDLDFTRIAIDTADTRYFRWNNWKNVSAIMAKDFDVDSEGSGRTVYSDPRLRETGNRYKNWYFEQMEQNLVPEINIPRPLMLFGGLASPPESWNFTGDEDDRVLAEIKEEFFRILDIVDFQYNNSAKVCQRIYTRLVEEQGKSVREYKRYITGTLASAYSYPTEGEYADTPEEQDLMDDQFTEKITQMGTYLQSIQQMAE